MAGIRDQQRLGQRSPLDVSRREQAVRGGVIRCRRSIANGFDGTVKMPALKEVATRRSGGWQTQVEGTFLQKKRAILAPSDHRGSRPLVSERTLSLQRFHPIVKF